MPSYFGRPNHKWLNGELKEDGNDLNLNRRREGGYLGLFKLEDKSLSNDEDNFLFHICLAILCVAVDAQTIELFRVC